VRHCASGVWVLPSEQLKTLFFHLMTFQVPKAVAAHSSFKPNLSRQEAEFLLALPGWKHVLRLNSEKTRVVVTFVQKSGVIAHSEIDVDGKGRVTTPFKQYDSIDAFVKELLNSSAAAMPTPSDLRKIESLRDHVYDILTPSQIEDALAKKRFLLRLSSSLEGVWIVSFKRSGPIIHVPIRSTTLGFTVDGLDGEVFGNFVSIIERLGVRSVATGKKVSTRSDADAGKQIYHAIGDLELELSRAAATAQSQREVVSERPAAGPSAIYESVQSILAAGSGTATMTASTLPRPQKSEYAAVQVLGTDYEAFGEEPPYDVVP
jgi:hypothetical protein